MSWILGPSSFIVRYLDPGGFQVRRAKLSVVMHSESCNYTNQIRRKGNMMECHRHDREPSYDVCLFHAPFGGVVLATSKQHKAVSLELHVFELRN